MDDQRRLAIEAACVRAIHRFALLNDAHDHAALADLFTADALYARPTDPDTPTRGRDAIMLTFRDRPKRRTRHVMSNIVVDVRSDGLAHAHSYVVLYTGERGETVLIGDFADVLAADDAGIWRFAERRGTLAFLR